MKSVDLNEEAATAKSIVAKPKEKTPLELYHLNVASKKTAYSVNNELENDGPNDKRSQRILKASMFTKGVVAYRSRLSRRLAAPTVSLSRVLARSRPLFQHEAKAGEWDSVTPLPQGGIVLHEGTEQLMRNHGMVKVLQHHIFETVEAVTTDDELYIAFRELLFQATQGKLSTFFFYGMTGSGKTFSMNVVHRRLPEDLFAILGDGATVRFHAYELVGKRCFDLLNGSAEVLSALDSETGKSEVFLRVDHDGATNMVGMKEHEVADAGALLELLRSAMVRRETSATGANATSSRSHAVYCLLLPGGGRLTMIDLAGSEAAQETLFHTKQHMMQAKEINKSLATLRACLRARATGAAHVPFRESTLTRVLKDALTNPAAATALVACVSPACSHLEHSLRTLRTAMYLTGRDHSSGGAWKTGGNNSKETIEVQVLKELSVQKGGPKTWSADELVAWVATQPFAAQVKLPDNMAGTNIMKLSQGRLRGMCGGDAAVAKALFLALRVASKEASQRDLEARKRLKRGNKHLTGAAGFAKSAPKTPVVHAAESAEQ